MKNDVRTLRTGRQLSQQSLAEAMDVSRQTINSIEKERYTPSLPLAIARARKGDTDGRAVACAVARHRQAGADGVGAVAHRDQPRMARVRLRGVEAHPVVGNLDGE